MANHEPVPQEDERTLEDPTYIITCSCGSSLFHITDAGVMCIECEDVIPFKELDDTMKPEITH